MEKSDKVDEWMSNRQYFPYQNFALKKVLHNLRLQFTNLSLSGFLSLCRDLYFCPILDKKDPPKDKELHLIRLGHYQSL